MFASCGGGARAMRAPDQKVPPDGRVAVQDFIEWLEELKNATLPIASKRERALLRRDAKLLDQSVKALVEIIGDYDAFHLGKENVGPWNPLGAVDLDGALFAAFLLGGLILQNPIVRRQAEQAQKEAQKASAAHARLTIAVTSRQRNEMIRQEAMQLWAQRPALRKSAGATAAAILKGTDCFEGCRHSGLTKRLRKLMRARMTD
jgi:hypothetical protein